MRSYLDDLFTPAVLAVQQTKGAAGLFPSAAAPPRRSMRAKSTASPRATASTWQR